MQKNKFAKFAILTITASLILAVMPAGARHSFAQDISIQELLDCTNKIRTDYGQGPLSINEKLTNAAQEKLEDMKKFNYWAHNNPYTKEQPWDFVDGAGYYYEKVGENLATGFSEAQKVCNAWRASSSHLHNLIDKAFLEVGFATDSAENNKIQNGTHLVVQMLGSSNKYTKDKLLEHLQEKEKSYPYEKYIMLLIAALACVSLLYTISTSDKKSKFVPVLSVTGLVLIAILIYLVLS